MIALDMVALDMATLDTAALNMTTLDMVALGNQKAALGYHGRQYKTRQRITERKLQL